MHCPHCGGVVGRDCFNVEECGAITQEIERREMIDAELEPLRAQLAAERAAHAAEVARYRAALEVMQAYLTGPVEFEDKAPELYALWIDEQQGLNCGGYLRLYVESALAADPGPLVAAVEGLVGALEKIISNRVEDEGGTCVIEDECSQCISRAALAAYRAALGGDAARAGGTR